MSKGLHKNTSYTLYKQINIHVSIHNSILVKRELFLFAWSHLVQLDIEAFDFQQFYYFVIHYYNFPLLKQKNRIRFIPVFHLQLNNSITPLF